MEKHFTVTGFVVHGDKTLLLWHPLMQGWAPPGGHVEPNEDPQEAVLREVREETGLEVCFLPAEQSLGIDYPRELAAPVTVLVEKSFEPGQPHQHVDLIYFCALLGEPPALPDDNSHLTWVDEERLRRNEPLPAGDHGSAMVAEDVRLLALRAMAKSRESGG
ncbi:MAG TPA: NUDIX domain-containing protein [Dehalococcoidia bacterium]|nr:NUDIX domain-containing protein [Dehalococcoidia bacterium]